MHSLVTRLPRVAKDLLLTLGLDLRLHSDDRRVLESIIFPYFISRPAYHRVLFVGCDWYTAGYPALFRENEFWTIDIDPRHRRYGSRRHIVDSVTHLASHFEDGTFDLIIFNGVIGYGLNDQDQMEEAFGAIEHCLRSGGILLIGWNQVSGMMPPQLEQSAALSRLGRFVLPPLGASDCVSENPNKHTFSFFQK
jgi:SAM-dependent methyltransferase